MQLDTHEVEEVCKDLYVRALKILPPDIKAGFARLQQAETHAIGQKILGTMVENIAVAERTNNILCQDTGIPIYNVTFGRDVSFDGAEVTRAIRRGCERATKEHSLRSSVVHPITRVNEQTSCGIRVPIIHYDFDDREETVEIEMIPKGSGSENGSFLQMLIPADGIKAVKRFVIDRVIELGGRVCPPTIVGVGIGGTSDLCMHLAKIAATRPLRSKCSDPEGAKIEAELSEAVNELGIGPQGLGGRSTSFAVHVEIAATHITQNPVAVNPLMEREGVRIIIGKGGMAQGTLDAFAELGGAYLAIVGGAAALETTWIEEIEDVDMDDLHPESLWRFRIRNFGPLLVGMDSHGGSMFADVRADVAARRNAILEKLGIAE